MPFLIVGLGNPGRSYQSTRHNVGFLALDWLAKASRAGAVRRVCDAKVTKVTLHGTAGWLAWPQTYVNRSGEAVRCLVKRFTVPLDRLMVVCDDMALPLGTLRLRAKGSAGGHNGLTSIIEHLGTQAFPRLRIGIGPAPDSAAWVQFVLAPLTQVEQKAFEPVFAHVADTVHLWLTQGLDRAMTQCNR